MLAGIAMRLLWTRIAAAEKVADMEVFAAQVIAGDALFSFYDMSAKHLKAGK